MQFKYPIFCLLAFLLSVPVSGQPQLTDLKKAKTHTLQPAPIEWGEKSLPFKKVVVVDSRFDTSKLGYIMGRRHYEKLHTSGPLAEAIQQTINTYQKPGNSLHVPTLYIFIKHLWLQQASSKEFNKQNVSSGLTNDTFFVACKATLECYLQIDDSLYSPLFRLDTTLVQKGILRKKAEALLSAPFQLTFQHLTRIDLNRKRKQMSWEEVIAYDNRNKKYTRLQADTLERGIYLTFQDFLHNRVTKTSFEVQWGLTDELYTIDGDNKKLFLELWGFCDGQKQYVKVGYNFFELSREQDTYEMIGAKKLIHMPDVVSRPTSSSPVDLISTGIINMAGRGDTKTTLLKPLQLNMETGEPY